MDPVEETSQTGGQNVDNNQERDNQNQSLKQRKGGHIVVTSSLGKDLDSQRLIPQSSSKVYVKAMSGARIKDIQKFIEGTPFEHKSVTVLVGGNNISNGQSMDQCCEDYTSLLRSISENNPEARINVVKIPPRIGDEEVTKRIYDFNQWLYDMCHSSESKNLTFIRNGLSKNTWLYQADKIHLSVHRGGGVSRLSMSIRKAILGSKENMNRPSMPPNERPVPQNNRQYNKGYGRKASPEWSCNPRGRGGPYPNATATGQAPSRDDIEFLMFRLWKQAYGRG